MLSTQNPNRYHRLKFMLFTSQRFFNRQYSNRILYAGRWNTRTITRFIADKASDRPTSSIPSTSVQDPVRLVLPFKDQASADIVRTQLKDLSQKVNKTIQPVFTSHKINQHLKFREAKPPLALANTQLFTLSNVTCAMQVMLVIHVGTHIYSLSVRFLIL